MIRHAERGRTIAGVFWFVAITAVVAPLGTVADEPTHRLVVPGVRQTLDMAVELTRDASGGRWQLREATPADTPSADGAVCPAQVVRGIDVRGLPSQGRMLIASIPPQSGAGETRSFVLERVPDDSKRRKAEFEFSNESATTLGVHDGVQDVFAYNHGLVTKDSVPADDHRRTKACYVHPVYGIQGEMLTDDFPRDHYHHHGIFWTWPHVQIDGQDHDLWAGDTIRQQFVKWLAKDAGEVTAIIGVENGWFVGDERVMIERVWLRPYRIADGTRAIDIRLTFIPLKPITLRGAEMKGYGGLSMRFHPPGGKNKNNVITIPDGVTEPDVSRTRMEWVDYTSKLSGQDYLSGASIFIHPDHPEYPPLWLCRHYGMLCVGFPGVENLTFQPRVPVTLEYRIWVHESAVEKDDIDIAWEAYRKATQARWE